MPQEFAKAHCNRCHRSTNHEVLASDRWESGEPDNDASWYDYELAEMLKCRGCDQVTLRVTIGGTGMEHPNVVYYPPAIARRLPDWAEYFDFIDEEKPSVPHDLWLLMKEVYVAVQNGLRRLAAMGIRAVLESVMIDKIGGDKGSFTANMDAFQAADYLNVRQRGHLEAVLGAGDAAIHRAWEPNDSQINRLLDITEAIVESAYLHDKPADILSRAVPSRPPRPRRKS